MRLLLSKRAQSIAAVFVAAAAFGISFFTYTTARASTVRKPYFAQTHMQHFDRTGALLRTVTLTEAVRADGSVSRNVSLSDDHLGSSPRHEMMLVPEGIAMVTDAGLKMKSTRSVRPEGLRLRTATTTDCLTAHPGPSNGTASCVPTGETRHGFRVDKMIRSNTDPDGVKRTIEALVARDLDWKDLEYNVYMDEVLRESRKVAYLVPGEPPASMFVIPTDYKEVSPAEMFQLSEESRGFKVPQAIVEGVRKRTPHGN